MFVTYGFDDIVLSDSTKQINKDIIKKWYWLSNYNRWQINSEFDPTSEVDVEVQVSYNSAIVMLVLDCSSSLINDFSTLKNAACNFIRTLANYTPVTTTLKAEQEPPQ